MAELVVLAAFLVVLAMSLCVLRKQNHRHLYNITKTDEIIDELQEVVNKLEEAVTTIEREEP